MRGTGTELPARIHQVRTQRRVGWLTRSVIDLAQFVTHLWRADMKVAPVPITGPVPFSVSNRGNSLVAGAPKIKGGALGTGRRYLQDDGAPEADLVTNVP